MNRAAIVICALLLPALFACAAKDSISPKTGLPSPADVKATLPTPTRPGESLPAPATLGGELGQNGKAIVFRHKVSVEIPDREVQSFDGILRLSRDNGVCSIRVLGLGGLGLTLFDLHVDPQNVTGYLHPRLSDIPHLADNIALCVRAMLTDDPARPPEENVAGGTGEWTLSRSGERPWPLNIIFKNNRPEYTVRIKLLGLREENGAKP